MSTKFQTTRRVEFADTDAAGIMHFSRFFTMMEEVEHEFLRSVGLSVLSEDEQGAISWPRVSVTCDFSAAVSFEQVLDIELAIARIGTKSVTYGFTFTHEGKPIATGKITAVCCRIHEDKPPESIAIPTNFIAKLKVK